MTPPKPIPRTSKPARLDAARHLRELRRKSAIARLELLKARDSFSNYVLQGNRLFKEANALFEESTQQSNESFALLDTVKKKRGQGDLERLEQNLFRVKKLEERRESKYRESLAIFKKIREFIVLCKIAPITGESAVMAELEAKNNKNTETTLDNLKEVRKRLKQIKANLRYLQKL